VKRGFKAETERIATEIRAELGLGGQDPLDPFQLASHLAIPVLTMNDLSEKNGAASFVRYFSFVDSDSFSAVTVIVGRRRIIIHNENHHPNRQASNVAHEVSHSLLEHQATAILSSGGQRFWNADMEDEANWLGAALLVPRDGALELARLGKRIDEIAANYGVSEQLCRWRVTQTGVLQQIERTRGWNRRLRGS
jgi:Zn-dependent peptidase ImmA (M78 family)